MQDRSYTVYPVNAHANIHTVSFSQEIIVVINILGRSLITAVIGCASSLRNGSAGKLSLRSASTRGHHQPVLECKHLCFPQCPSVRLSPTQVICQPPFIFINTTASCGSWLKGDFCKCLDMRSLVRSKQYNMCSIKKQKEHLSLGSKMCPVLQ